MFLVTSEALRGFRGQFWDQMFYKVEYCFLKSILCLWRSTENKVS